MNFGWSYKQENWNLFKNTFLNNSWSSCSFTYDSYSIVPKSRGVYLIISSPLESNSKDSYQAPFDTMATPLYIGYSLNLQDRFKTHTSNKANTISAKLSWNRGTTKFWFTEFPQIMTKDELKTFEQILIDTFGSPMGKINSQTGIKTVRTLNGNLKNPNKEIVLASLLQLDDVEGFIDGHEDKFIELKESFYEKNPKSDEQHIDVNHSILKSIAAFLNTEGGYLIIGVSDDKQVIGINKDPKYTTDDKYIRAIEDKITNCLDSHMSDKIDYKVFNKNEEKVLVISCKKSKKEVWCKDVKYNQRKYGLNHNQAEGHYILYIRRARGVQGYAGREAHEFLKSSRFQ